MKEPFGNPTTGEVKITLKDGVVRTLVFDFSALFVLEEITGKPFIEAARMKVTATALRTLLYAGLYSDAEKRGDEEWSLKKVQSLIDVAQVGRLAAALSWALTVSLTRMREEDEQVVGELQASAAMPRPDGAGPDTCDSPAV